MSSRQKNGTEQQHARDDGHAATRRGRGETGRPVGLVPLAIGAGFLIDTRLQTRDMEQTALHNSSVDPSFRA